MYVPPGQTINPGQMRVILEEVIQKMRPPWYERTPWSWGIGAALAVTTSVIGDGIAHWMGWS